MRTFLTTFPKAVPPVLPITLPVLFFFIVCNNTYCHLMHHDFTDFDYQLLTGATTRMKASFYSLSYLGRGFCLSCSFL